MGIGFIIKYLVLFDLVPFFLFFFIADNLRDKKTVQRTAFWFRYIFSGKTDGQKIPVIESTESGKNPFVPAADLKNIAFFNVADKKLEAGFTPVFIFSNRIAHVKRQS